jgi:hypothetical protein
MRSTNEGRGRIKVRIVLTSGRVIVKPTSMMKEKEKEKFGLENK